MLNDRRKESIEKRIEPRTPYSGQIFFSTKNGFYEGRLKNYSQHGLFIETVISLPVGEMITVALPYLDATADKRKGQVMWSNKDGFGVELFRKRNAAAQMYIQSDLKLNKQKARAMVYN
ncbi:MAG: PilZ domain-containing protein [Desulfobacterales bacterium]|jgi:hypothetical protein